MKVALVFPPQAEPYMPYLTVPWLSTYLASKGVEVVQRDLNIETYHICLSEAFLNKSLATARKDRADLEAREGLSESELARYHHLLKVAVSGDYVIDHVGDALRVFTSEKFYDPVNLMTSYRLINSALRLAMAPWYPTLLSLGEFAMPTHTLFKSTELLEAVGSDRYNPFRGIFRTHFLDSILQEPPGLVGISIATRGQVVAGLTLAALIKEAAPDVHVCIGGQIPSRWEKALPRMRNLFRLFDSAVVREGEIPLFELVAALEAGESLEKVPNLIYRDGDQIRANPITGMVDIDSLPTPSFDGLPLDSYLLPELVLPLFSQRGCYWGKCAFCDHFYGFENYYVARDLDLLVEDIRELSARYKTRFFSFSDENTPPARLTEFSKKVIDANLDIRWLLPLRFEREYTPEISSLAHQAGCNVVMWGMESACQRVLDAMEKGTNVQVNESVLKNFAEAGIWNHAAIVLGFPSEERDEAEATIDYLANHGDWINGVFDNVFMLVPWSVVANEPERFKITKVEDDSLDLVLLEIYYPHFGMSYEEARSMQVRLLSRLRQVHPNFDFWRSLTWFHTLLYVTHNGYPQVARMRTQADAAHLPDGWKNVIVKLEADVFQVKRLFDGGHMTAGTAQKGEYHTLYDLDSDRFFSVSQTALQLLNQGCRGRKLADIASDLSASTGVAPEKVESACVGLVEKLLSEKLLYCE